MLQPVLSTFLQCWQKRAGRRWQPPPGTLPSSHRKELPAYQSQDECPRQCPNFPALNSSLTFCLHAESGDLYEYLQTGPRGKCTPRAKAHGLPRPEPAQPHDSHVIHVPPSPSVCCFLSSPSFPLSRAGAGQEEMVPHRLSATDGKGRPTAPLAKS